MLNKKEFTKYINRIKSWTAIEVQMTKALNCFDPDFNYFSLGELYETSVELLEKAMNDNTSIISYFIYDLDFGREKRSKNCITEKDGTKISLQTVNDLYKYLIKNVD